MNFIKSLKERLNILFAIIEKYLKLETRFKIEFLMRFLTPLITTLIPLFIFGVLFTINSDYYLGSWNSSNYLLFMLILLCFRASLFVIFISF